MTDQPILVAVYGSLRRGMGNHRLLTSSEQLTTERIKGFDMFSLGGYPFIKPGDGEITIEVYAVDSHTFRRLDSLEGYPSFYNRMLVQTSVGKAWIYYIAGRDGKIPVPDGDWVQYYTST